MKELAELVKRKIEIMAVINYIGEMAELGANGKLETVGQVQDFVEKTINELEPELLAINKQLM